METSLYSVSEIVQIWKANDSTPVFILVNTYQNWIKSMAIC